MNKVESKPACYDILVCGKTIKGKKAIMTREINGLESHLAELEDLWNRRGDKDYFTYMTGERIYVNQIERLKKEIEFAKHFKNTLNHGRTAN